MDDRHHYVDCGLDNIYLVNGFKTRNFNGKEFVQISHPAKLHKAITSFLVHSPTALSRKELRFLRKEMNLSQKALGDLIGKTDQAVARWESGKGSIDPSSDRLVKMLANERILEEQSEISELLRMYAELDNQAYEARILFAEQEDRWSKCA